MFIDNLSRSVASSDYRLHVDNRGRWAYVYVCAHEKTRFKSQILEIDLNADYETKTISRQLDIYFKWLSLLVA